MSWWNSFIVPREINTHLRDSRHANTLFTQYGHLFSPKVKFLYHVVFEPAADVSFNSNTREYNKQIGVLVKSADLPAYRADIQNKQQYNRKKNLQTRIDYQDIRIVLHDDNLGATRAMLEEYYRFYFQDGNHVLGGTFFTPDGSFGPRDKYSSITPNYGLNNFLDGPFFSSIKIYQLSLQNWYSYTLVNPLLSGWEHGSVDSSSGSEMNENSITIAYESVLYDNGTVGEDGEPKNFTDAETGYDNTFSPLSSAVNNKSSDFVLPTIGKIVEDIFDFNLPFGTNDAPGLDVFGRITSQQLSQTPTFPSTTNTIPGYLIPVRDTQSNNLPDAILKVDRVSGDPETTYNLLTDNPTAYNSFLAKLLNTGYVEGLDYEAYLRLSPSEQSIILTDIQAQALSGDYKIFTFMKAALEIQNAI